MLYNFRNIYIFALFNGQQLSPHLISGPMTEFRRSMALAWALVKLDVGSLLIAKMMSPTPSLPSWQTEPPWATLRTSMPEPSLIALTDMPANVRTHRHTNTHRGTHKHRWVEGWLRLRWLHAKHTDAHPNKHLAVATISIIKSDTRQISAQARPHTPNICMAQSHIGTNAHICTHTGGESGQR